MSHAPVLTGGEGPGEPQEPEITDYNYIGSAIGNAYFSGVSFDQLWDCVSLAKTREELDEAVSATIRVNEIANESGKAFADAARPASSSGRSGSKSPLDVLRGCAARLSAYAFRRN